MDWGETRQHFFKLFLPAMFLFFLLRCQQGNPLTADDSSVVKDAATGFQALLLNNQLIVRPDWAKLCPIRVQYALCSTQCIAGHSAGRTPAEHPANSGVARLGRTANV